MSTGSRIADVEAVPADTTLLFRVRDLDDDEVMEAILVELDDGTVTGWFNHCQHFTHIMLDKGSGAPMRNGELVCANHGAMFEADSGECTYGPCEGAMLDPIDVTVEDGGIYLSDPEFEFVDTGGIETADHDLTSRSNIEF
jgi:nitrite reductase/ring-hydroxylating ferredoxin subunit